MIFVPSPAHIVALLVCMFMVLPSTIDLDFCCIFAAVTVVETAGVIQCRRRLPGVV